MKPRVIVCALYAWNATLGGRFVAIYLSDQAFLSDSSIGTILAIQVAIASLLAGPCGKVADDWERCNPLNGRLNVIRIGILFGLSLSILEGLGNRYLTGEAFGEESKQLKIIFLWNFLLRSFGYAIAIACTQPIMDGVILAHLKNEMQNTHVVGIEDYGKERLHGAIWWGLSSAVVGILCDQLGFDIALLIMALITSSFCFTLIYFYERNLGMDAQKDETKLLVNRMGKNDVIITEGEEGACSNIVAGDDYSLAALMGIAFGTSNRIAFFVVFGLLNIGMAVVENLVFLFYLESLGSSKTMCGITVIGTVIFELPVFYAAPVLLRIGPGKLLLVACIAFIIRTIGYVLVPTMGWAVFCLDMLHGISFACSQIASVEFIAQIMPNTCEASGQGLLLLVRGLGATVGLCLGGVVEDKLGGRGLYACLSGVVTAALLLFGITLAKEENVSQN